MSSTNKNQPAEPSWTSSLLKALQPGSQWPDKDELLDVIYWGKQILSLFIGFVFGVTSLSGILAILSYVAISSVVTLHYVTKFQKFDDEELGGFFELSKEGFGAAFATFMVTWITIYTSIHQV